MITKAKKLTVLTCGHTTLDLELVVTGHNNPALVRHLMPCCHGPGEDGKIAHPIYAYIIEHETGRMMVDTGMSESFRKDWKNNFYMEQMAYDPGEDGSFLQRLAQQDLKPSDFPTWSLRIFIRITPETFPSSRSTTEPESLSMKMNCAGA